MIRSWRCCSAEDGRGVMVYFDPYLEDVTVRQLTAPERASRIDRSRSVSALPESEAPFDFDYDQLHIELNA